MEDKQEGVCAIHNGRIVSWNSVLETGRLLHTRAKLT